ncbi:MAG TPA: DUF4962 domain-containing protein [Plantibacter sp.]|uniref:DUF4962 domain-containing protein n=1 Tax=unclassified Plantibacter TaxID=2624265 RepID=UPI002CC6BE2C|nr:DUF4962 domain-containing protein [Plantibacter sp.]
MIPALLLDGREDQLRAELTGVRRREFRRLLEECERLRGIELPTEHPLASITYFGPAAANLALAHRLTGQQQYLEELRRWLAPPLAFEHWGRAHMPDHDLDAGWLLHGLSLALAWAGDALPPGERTALRDRLTVQGTRLYDFAVDTEGDWWSSSYWQNHNWICFAGLATAGYVLADEHPDALAWTERAKTNFDTVLDLLPADGSNHEGVVYWRYGEPWLVSYLDVLRAAEGVDWFPRSAHLRETFWFRLYQAAPDFERIVDHGDCHDHRSGHSVALYRKLAAEYRIPQAQWLADRVADDFFWREASQSGVRPGVLPEAYQELLWFEPSVLPVGPDELPTARHFPDLGLVAGRTSWREDATLVSFKAGPGGGWTAWRESHRHRRELGWTTLNTGHHHPDAGTFVLLGGGEYLAIDEGYSSRKRTEHHSGILVDGVGYGREGHYDVHAGLDEERVAELREVTLVGDWVHAVSEIGALYAPELGVRRLRRHLVRTPAGALVLVDDLQADSPRAWTWLLQTTNPAEELGDGRWSAPAGGAALLVTTLDAVDSVDEVHPTLVQANPTSSTPGLEIERVQHTLRRRSVPSTSVRFVTVLQPVRFGEMTPSTASLIDDDGELVVSIPGACGTEEIVLRLDAERPGRAQSMDAVGKGFAGRTLRQQTEQRLG